MVGQHERRLAGGCLGNGRDALDANQRRINPHGPQGLRHVVDDGLLLYLPVDDAGQKQAQAIGDIPEREKVLDRDMEWILLDDGFPTVFETRGYSYRPIWLRPASAIGRAASGGRGAPSSGRTSFGDVAGGFAGWAENTMGRLASAILPGSLQVPSAQGGVINLGGVDKVTGDIFKAMATSSGSSGGGRSGGGCACACAGCACACACAGGGR